MKVRRRLCCVAAALCGLATWFASVGCDDKVAPTGKEPATSANSSSRSAPKLGDASSPAKRAAVPAAFAHIPAGCDAVIALDTARLFAEPAIRDHVVAALERAFDGGELEGDLDPIRAIMKDAAIGPASPRSIAVCIRDLSNQGDPNVTVAIEAKISPTFDLASVLKRLGGKPPTTERVDGVDVVKNDRGFIARLADDVVIVGNTPAAAADVIQPADRLASYDLDGSAELLSVVTQPLLHDLISSRDGRELLGAAKRLATSVDFGAERATVRVAYASPEEAKASFDRGWQGLVEKLIAKGTGRESEEALDIVKTMKTRLEGADVVADLTLPIKNLEAWAKRFANEIEKATIKGR